MLDYLFSLASTLPWRCESCGARFFARTVPARSLFYAHCRICGNLALQRISAEYVPGPAAILGRILGMPALRCEPCRHKFFSVRPLKQEKRAVAATPSE